MVRIIIKVIKWYQKIPFKCHYSCKHILTCSNYAIAVLNDFGFFKGSYLAIKRILKCNLFTPLTIDLPPKKESK